MKRPRLWGACGLWLLVCASCATAGKNPPAVPTADTPSLKLLQHFMEGEPLPQPAFPLDQPGWGEPLDYEKFGEFQNVGTPQFRFVVKDGENLKQAVGAGIYPNELAITQQPLFHQYKEEGALQGSHWSWLKSDDLQKAFFVWAMAPEEKGAKTFFTAMILEKAGHLIPAIKAYYATLVHFPRSAVWGEDKNFVWYVGPASIEAIRRILRDHPQLGWDLVDASAKVEGGLDTNLSNDVITVNPGRFVRKTLAERHSELPQIEKLKILETRGKGKVTLVQFANGHWQMRVDGKPFFINGITYHPTEVGLGPHNDERFLDKWMFTDKDHNGRIDAAYDAWVDANRNDRQDPDEPSIGDFQLLADMGVNAIRFMIPNRNLTEYDPSLINKPLLREMTEKFGIRIIACDLLGAYTQGSGASWEKGTDYTDPEQLRKMKTLVRSKVLDLKDEPFVLMWILGNENNMAADYMGVNATRTNASVHPEAYARFLNEVAAMIHELDPDHPVAVGNIEFNLLDSYAKYAPALDIVGMNSYRGKEGFGSLWEDAKAMFDRPMLITEYGADAYFEGKGEDEDGQLEYDRGNFRDIIFHQAGGPSTGNAIGGVLFQYLDEWWKDTRGDPENHQQTESAFKSPMPDGYDHEEWFGIAGQGNGENSPFKRQLRKTYFFYRDNAR